MLYCSKAIDSKFLEKLRTRGIQTVPEGHFGSEKMQLRAHKAVFWPAITSDLLQTTQSSEVCQSSRGANNAKHFSREVPPGAWEKLGKNLFKFQSTSYLLIADYYRWFLVIRKYLPCQWWIQTLSWAAWGWGEWQFFLLALASVDNTLGDLQNSSNPT